MDPTRRQARLDYQDVPATRLRTHGDGWDLVSEVLDRAAVALAAEQVGVASRALDMAVEYAKVRAPVRAAHRLLPGRQASAGRRPAGGGVGARRRPLRRCSPPERENEQRAGPAELPAVASLAKAFCSDACRTGDAREHPGARRHRLHLGAPGPPVSEAGQDVTAAVRATRLTTGSCSHGASAWKRNTERGSGMKVDGKLSVWQHHGGRGGGPAPREGRLRRPVVVGVQRTTPSCRWCWRPSTPSGWSSARPSRSPSPAPRCSSPTPRTTCRPTRADGSSSASAARSSRTSSGASRCRGAIPRAAHAGVRPAPCAAIWAAWNDGDEARLPRRLLPAHADDAVLLSAARTRRRAQGVPRRGRARR